jgi:hypothetical protein
LFAFMDERHMGRKPLQECGADEVVELRVRHSLEQGEGADR